MVEFEQVAQKYEDMKRIAFEVEFRKRDNELQKKKGQASLDEEDTGTQWHNDPR